VARRSKTGDEGSGFAKKMQILHLEVAKKQQAKRM
jgi:hypothetical protein